MRSTLQALHDAAKPDSLQDAAKDETKLLDIVRRVWGPEATVTQYREFLTRWHRLKARGQRLAELLVVYGPVVMLSRDDLDALDIAQPYAYALRVRMQADAEIIARGGIGDLTYYMTQTNGDVKEATRLRNEAFARAKIGA